MRFRRNTQPDNQTNQYQYYEHLPFVLTQLPYSWNSQTYNAAGTFQSTLTRALMDATVATFNLTIKPTSTSTTNIAICPNQLPYSWNSQTYNAAGTFLSH